MPQFQSTHYLLEYTHYSVGVLIDSLKHYITTEVFPIFRTSVVTTYNKFIAALQGKTLIESPSNLKETAVIGSETVATPALALDPTAIEPDESVTPFFWNFPAMCSLMETVTSKSSKMHVEKDMAVYLQRTYIKVTVDCHALFESVYQKLDFDYSLLLHFKGLNRIVEPYKVDALIPLPYRLLEDYPSTDWNTVFPGSVVKVVNQTGESRPHLRFNIAPKITLTALTEESEKLGSDKLPMFKSGFSFIVEGFCLSSIVVIPLLGTSQFFTILSTGNPPQLMNLTYMFLQLILQLLSGLAYFDYGRQVLIIKKTLSNTQIEISLEELSQAILDLARRLGISVEQLFTLILKFIQGGLDLEEALRLLTEIASVLRLLLQISNLPIWLIEEALRQIFKNMGGKSFVPATHRGLRPPSFSFTLGRICQYDVTETSVIEYRVPRDVTIDETLVIPNSVYTGLKPITVFGTAYGFEIQSNQIVVNGPLSNGQILSILVEK